MGLAAKRLRATVNLGSTKKKACLGKVQQGMEQGGCGDDVAPVNTEVVVEVFGRGVPEDDVESELLESLLEDPFLSSSTADEINIVNEGDVEEEITIVAEADVSTVESDPTLDENENPPSLKQVIEKGKKTRRFISFTKYNELRLKEIERMKLLEEVKKRVGSIDISKK